MSELSLPEVSVILPVYNCEKYLAASIQSILDQTFKNFEIIIINDGSKDNSGRVAQSFSDSRIRYFEQSNIGLAATLNRGISLARAEMIARQDQDDISLPTRLEKEVGFLARNPKVSLVGSAAEIWADEKPLGRKLVHPLKNRELQSFLCFDNPFVHSSVMFRKKAVLRVGGYRVEKRYQPEDYDLWIRLAENGQIANLPDALLVYREVGSSMSRVGTEPFPNVSLLAAARISRIFRGIIPLKILERMSSDLRNRVPFSRFRAAAYLKILILIGCSFGFSDPQLCHKIEYCKKRLLGV